MPASPTASQLAPALLRTGSPVLFALGGPIVAQALVTGTWRNDAAVGRLIDTMVQRLPEIVEAGSEIRHPSLLVDLAVTHATLAVTRPLMHAEVRHHVHDLVARIPPAEDRAALPDLRVRALLAVAVDRDAVARHLVEELDRRGDVLGATLGKWAAGQRRRRMLSARLDGLGMLARRFSDLAEPRLLALAAFSLPEPSRTLARVAPRRRFTPVRH